MTRMPGVGDGVGGVDDVDDGDDVDGVDEGGLG